MELWFHGTLVPWNFGSVGLWFQENGMGKKYIHVDC